MANFPGIKYMCDRLKAVLPNHKCMSCGQFSTPGAKNAGSLLLRVSEELLSIHISAKKVNSGYTARIIARKFSGGT